jgi:2-(1,2-epoxy-1,2-dihydrophenyl)acetyl-CoA isomerase
MKYKTIIVEKKEGIAFLTLNRPETLNAWNATMAEEVVNALNEINNDESMRILIITGAGRGFSSGADIRRRSSAAAPSETSETLYTRLARGKPTVVDIGLRLQRLDKPVIGAINGMVVGAGLSIALACDLRIASEKAQFSMIFIKRGLIPDCGGSFFLPKLIGSAKACELIFTGDIIDAREAERIGLVNKVVPHEELMKATEELANKLLKRPPISLKYAKRAIYKGLTEVDLASHIDYEISLNRMLHDTEDFEEGIKAFLEKREPVFKGK